MSDLNINLQIAETAVRDSEASMQNRLALPHMHVKLREVFVEAFEAARDHSDPKTESTQEDELAAQELKAELGKIQNLIAQKDVAAMVTYLGD